MYRPTTDYKGKLPKKKVKEGDTGSDVKRAQEFLNWSLDAKLKVDGEYGPKTVKACKKFQKRYGVEGNGGFGWRTKMIACCQIQAVHMRDAKYGKYKPVTKKHTEDWGTCVTFEGMVWQIFGLLKSGDFIWQNGKGYGTGKVYGTTDDMEVTYMNNKTLKSLKSKLRAGDCILCDDNRSGRSGEGGHIFTITDKWDSKGNPYIWDVGMKMLCERNGKPRKYDGSHKVLARVRPKER